MDYSWEQRAAECGTSPADIHIDVTPASELAAEFLHRVEKRCGSAAAFVVALLMLFTGTLWYPLLALYCRWFVDEED